jgi:hypothetical protein
MENIGDIEVRRKLTERLNKLNENSQPLWGKMNAPQMLKHCRLWEEIIHNNETRKRPFIGRLIGPLIMKQVLKGPGLRKNSPTIPEMVITDNSIDLQEERQKLIALLDSYKDYNLPDYAFIHPFFGKMTREQLFRLVYLHLHHHLSQFGV